MSNEVIGVRRSGRLLAALVASGLMAFSLFHCGDSNTTPPPATDGGGGGTEAGNDVSPIPDAAPPPVDAAPPGKLYATWAAAPQNFNSPGPAGFPTPIVLTNKTVRHTMQTSVGGEQIRIRISNVYGGPPLVVDGAHVALAKDGSEIDVATDKVIKVGGLATFSVPGREEVWSDPIPLVVGPNTKVAVTLFVSAATAVATVHAVGMTTTYIGDGNTVGAATIAAPTTRQEYLWVNGIDVYRRDPVNVVVTLGDSITDGAGSTVDANRRYPNYLSQRLAADATARPVSVINAGLAGNRVVTDGAGTKGPDRFERDVLSVSGVTHAIVLLGINDIGACALASQCVTTPQIIAGLTSIVAKAKGVKIQMSTLMPFENAMLFGTNVYSPAGEIQRQDVNTWIRANTEVDGVIDFDLLMRDPGNLVALLPSLANSDHLHPTDTGYDTMAKALDLTKLR